MHGPATNGGMLMSPGREQACVDDARALASRRACDVGVPGGGGAGAVRFGILDKGLV